MAQEPERPKSPIVRTNEAVSNISQQLDRVKDQIARIASTGIIGVDNHDLKLMLACTRYVAARQVLHGMLEREAE